MTLTILDPRTGQKVPLMTGKDAGSRRHGSGADHVPSLLLL
jgi:hypothetical protein